MDSSWCLVTDIDDTLLGNDDAIPELRQAVLGERQRLEAVGGRLFWAIATGRHLTDAAEVLIANGFALGDFDALITAVGAKLHHLGESDQPVLDDGYLARLNSTGFDAAEVKAVLSALDFLIAQPDHEQFPHKVSYFTADTAENRSAVGAALENLAFPTLTVWAHGQYLDVAPVTGLKGGAVEYLIEIWGLGRVVVAGDSGNDLSMLDRGWTGIIPAGYQPELEVLRRRPNVHFAQGRAAAGVLEGLKVFGFVG